MIVLALLCVGTFAVPESASALAKKPERVTVIKAESAYDSITLTWKPSENARSYIIYRSGSKYGFYREIGTVRDLGGNPRVTGGLFFAGGETT